MRSRNKQGQYIVEEPTAWKENGFYYYGIPGKMVNRLDSFTEEFQKEIKTKFNLK